MVKGNKIVSLLVILALVLSLGVAIVPMAGTVKAQDPATLHVSKWTEYPNNPVFAPEYKAYYPSVLKIDGTYYMYTSDGSIINYATSTDGILTIEAWIYADTKTNWACILEKADEKEDERKFHP